ncbi:MAG: hypothetical protein ACQPRJ_03635 [Solitalea-like symbiont of Acarus siro]
MKTFNIICLSLISLILFNCSKEQVEDKIKTKNNLHLLPKGENTTIDVYYSLPLNKESNEDGSWDLKFNWKQNYHINSNTKYSTSQGKLNFIDKAFNEVSLADITKKFTGSNGSLENFTNIQDFGLNTDTQVGWIQKNSNNILLPVKDRTLVLITPVSANNTNKKMYIIEIKSVYKDAPANPDQNSKAAFISFRYKEIETEGIIKL